MIGGVGPEIGPQPQPQPQPPVMINPQQPNGPPPGQGEQLVQLLLITRDATFLK